MKLAGKLCWVVGALAGWAPCASGQSFDRPWSIQECVETALGNSVALHNARNDVAIAEQNVVQARAGFLPQLSASAARSWAESPGSWAKSARVGADLSQSLYSGGGNRARLTESVANRRRSENALRDIEQSVILNARQKYLEYLKSQSLQGVAEEALGRSEEHLRKTEHMYQIGSVTKAYVLKSRVQLASDRLNLIDARNKAELARADLCHAIGLQVETPLKTEQPAPDTTWSAPGFEQALRLALERRSDLAAKRWGVAGKEAGVKAARSSLLPSLSGRAGYSWEDESFGEAGDMFDRGYTWSYRLSLSIPLFEGFATRAEVKAAKRAAVSAALSLRQAEQDVALEIKRVLLQLKHAKERMAAAEEAMVSAREDLRLAEEGYRLGKAAVLEVIDAQVGLTEALNAQAEALHERELARLSLKRATGTLKGR